MGPGDPVPDGVDVEKLVADAEPAALGEEELDAEGEKGGRKQSLSSGDRLFRWASDVTDLYCDGDDAYADVRMDGHSETLAIHSKGLERWLRRLFLERTGRVATREALNLAQDNLDAQAARAGQRRVYQHRHSSVTDSTSTCVTTPIRLWRSTPRIGES